MSRLDLKPTHKAVQNYYLELRQHPLRVDGARHPLFASTGGRARARCRNNPLARRSINPNLDAAAIEEMGSTGHWPVPSGDSPDGTARPQALDFARTFRIARCCRSCRRVARATHARRNIIPAEIEKVLDALASQSFRRAAFLKMLDSSYLAIEHAAAAIADFRIISWCARC